MDQLDTNQLLLLIKQHKKIQDQNEDAQFDIKEIAESKKIRRHLCKEQYRKLYCQCLIRIKQANFIGNTEIYYQIPETLIESHIYQASECMKYIIKHLRKHHFSVEPYTELTINVSWKNIKT